MLKLPEGFKFRKSTTYSATPPEALDHGGGGKGPLLVYEVKEDGWRVLVTPRHCFSRGVSKVTGEQIDLGEIPCVQKIQECLLPNDAIEAELIVPGGIASDVPTALKAGGNRSVLRVKPFNYAMHKGKPIKTWKHSRTRLEEWAEDWRCELSRVWIFGGPNFYPDYQKLCDAALLNGWEGFMVKQRDGAAWMKMKLERTLDVVVTGWELGKGKYEGILGALEVAICVDEPPYDYTVDGDDGETHLRVLAKVSGMTDEQRLEFTGRDMELEVIEVKAQGHGGKRRLRHPRFLRLRPDKPWKECR